MKMSQQIDILRRARNMFLYQNAAIAKVMNTALSSAEVSCQEVIPASTSRQLVPLPPPQQEVE